MKLRKISGANLKVAVKAEGKAAKSRSTYKVKNEKVKLEKNNRNTKSTNNQKAAKIRKTNKSSNADLESKPGETLRSLAIKKQIKQDKAEFLKLIKESKKRKTNF